MNKRYLTSLSLMLASSSALADAIPLNALRTAAAGAQTSVTPSMTDLPAPSNAFGPLVIAAQGSLSHLVSDPPPLSEIHSLDISASAGQISTFGATGAEIKLLGGANVQRRESDWTGDALAETGFLYSFQVTTPHNFTLKASAMTDFPVPPIGGVDYKFNLTFNGVTYDLPIAPIDISGTLAPGTYAIGGALITAARTSGSGTFRIDQGQIITSDIKLELTSVSPAPGGKVDDNGATLLLGLLPLGLLVLPRLLKKS